PAVEAPGTASRTRYPRAGRASRRGASSARIREAAARTATRERRAPARGRLQESIEGYSGSGLIDIIRYIESIYRRKDHRRSAGSRTGARMGHATALERACARLYTCPVPSVTDYALARRAVLRDFRSGALTRLDV